MTKLYGKNAWQDEVLAGYERYTVKDNVGAVIHDDVEIALKTGVVQAGTLADAAKMNNIENGVDAVDSRVDANETIQNTLLTGWIAGVLTWTYASANTLTMPGDVTAKFPKGTKIKLTQTTVKYFYVVNAVYSAPNTTLTLAGGSDYTLANEAITSPFYSYADSPQGFPDWFNWTPTFSCSGSMTFTGTTISQAAFKILGRQVQFLMNASGTTGGTASNTIFFTLPVVAANGIIIACSAIVVDVSAAGGLSWKSATNQITVRRYDSSSFGLGAARVISAQGAYDI
jgi:hypothetical protein